MNVTLYPLRGSFPIRAREHPCPPASTVGHLLALSNELVLTLVSTYNKGKNKLRVLPSENVRKDGLKKQPPTIPPLSVCTCTSHSESWSSFPLFLSVD